MKMQVDGTDICELKPWEIDVLKHVLPAKGLEEDMKRRAAYFWTHKVDQCYKALETEWTSILQADQSVTSIPATKEGFVNFVRGRPDYKDRDAKDLENPTI